MGWHLFLRKLRASRVPGAPGAQHTFHHCLGCVLAHYPVSRLIFSRNMATCDLGYFLPKKHPFSDPPGPGITPGWGRKVPNTPLPIAWAVFWPIIQFPGWFFRAIWQPVIWVTFYPKNTHFRTHLDLELHLDGAEKCPTHLSPLLGLCFGPLFSFQVGYRPGMAAYHDGPFWTQKRAVFGRPLTWK